MNQSTESALRRRVGVGALLTLLLSTLVIEGIPVLHAHAAAEPAIYNEACPLAGLAAHTAGAPLPSAVSTGSPLIAAPAPDLSAAQLASSLVFSNADPRAPPPAS